MIFIAMHLIILILLPVPGYELSSDEEEISFQHNDLTDGGSALDDLQPRNGPPILQQPPAPTPFDFAAFIRRSGGNTTALSATLPPQYEKLMHIYHLDPSMYTVNELEDV